MLYLSLSDTELWNLFIEGDDRVLEFVYTRQYRALMAYGLKLCMDEELVKDCIQDLFVKLYVNRKSLTKITNINTYLVKALKNTIYNKLSRTVPMLELENMPFELKVKDDFLSLFSENDEELKQRGRLREIIKRLPSRQQEIIYLRFVRELSYEEIGEILEINYQSVKNLTSRMMHKIRSLFLSKD
jgi:RNA polymerase sigma-70 factor (ECF subfamily)